MPDRDGLAIVPFGDSMIAIEFDARIDPEVNRAAIALAGAIEAAGLPGVRDVVPTCRTVAVHYDPLRTDYERLIEIVKRAAATPAAPTRDEPVDPIRVPVCYDPELGPDLLDVAAERRLTPAEVVALHTARTYRVFMLGFLPGFAYMGTVDERLAMPRLPTPRVRVPKGSVAIAGRQTGIYPSESPGGWRLIGRTPVRPFDPDRANPFLFRAGDAVEFQAIDRSTYERMGGVD